MFQEIVGFTRPFAVQQNSLGEILVGDFGEGSVSIYTPSLKKIIVIRQLAGPHSISIDKNEDLVICEFYAKKISYFSGSGIFLKTVLNGNSENLKKNKLMTGPAQMRIHPNGNFYVSDYGSSSIQIFDPKGVFLFKIENGFDRNHSLAFDDEENMWVTDTWNHRVMIFDKEGKFQSCVEGEFDTPVSIDFSEGKFVISENGTSTVQCFSSKDGKQLWKKSGYNHPYDVKLKGIRLLVADADNRRVVIEDV